MADYGDSDDEHETCGYNGYYCSNKCPKLDAPGHDCDY